MTPSRDTIRLCGIAWNHTRGFTPLVATTQRYGALHPKVEITWEKRSLQAFADAPIEKLAAKFDLPVIDHPFAGFAARHSVPVDMNVYAAPGPPGSAPCISTATDSRLTTPLGLILTSISATIGSSRIPSPPATIPRGRPRYCGYLHFQDQGGDLGRNFLVGKNNRQATLADLDVLHQQSLSPKP